MSIQSNEVSTQFEPRQIASSTNSDSLQVMNLFKEFSNLIKVPECNKLNDFSIVDNSKEINKFNEAWTESSKALENTPLEPLASELGKQLASGKLDAEALQKVLKDIKFPEEDLGDMSKKFRQLREKLQENYGLDVQIEWRGKGDQVMPAGLTISEANGHRARNTEIHVGLDGKPVAQTVNHGGIAGTIVEKATVDGAMKMFHERIIKPKQ